MGWEWLCASVLKRFPTGISSSASRGFCRVLQPNRPDLRELLAISRADRASRDGPGGDQGWREEVNECPRSFWRGISGGDDSLPEKQASGILTRRDCCTTENAKNSKRFANRAPGWQVRERRSPSSPAAFSFVLFIIPTQYGV
jgi:hypothetical protein